MLRRLVLALAIALPLGCSEGGGATPDLSSNPSDLSLKDLAQAASSCGAASDCRLYSNTCDQCSCEALRTDEVDPVCNGTPVSCFVDPCSGKSADCQSGHCIVK